MLDKAAFTRAMLEKLVWISGVMLVGQKHKAIVGQVEREHSEEVSKLFAELAAAGGSALRQCCWCMHALQQCTAAVLPCTWHHVYGGIITHGCCAGHYYHAACEHPCI